MSAKLKYTIVILSALLAALGIEVWFAFDPNPDTPPLTELIVDHIPWEVTRAVIVGGAVWLYFHFGDRYRRKERDLG